MRRKLKRACADALKQTFGLPDYRPGQKAAVYALLSGRDLLCLLPTGAGKSLCWQLPALLHPGLTLVVSPLIALMRDQVHHLTERGIPAVTLDSLLSREKRIQTMAQLRSGAVRIVFASPERLETPEFFQLCQETPPWLLVVDEAHCVVQWGQHFRPAYSRISAFMTALPRRPVVCALTATADRTMQHQILADLCMTRPRRVILPVLRENLRYHVRTALDSTAEMLRIAAQNPGKTVVFCRTRARTEQLSAALTAAGYPARHYHAGLTRPEREAAQQAFADGRVRILTATTAFGMGIDIPDIRMVVHDALPDSVIDYVQQSGRAGRDRQPADCILLLTPADILRLSWQLYYQRENTKCRPICRHALQRKTWKPMRQLLTVCLTAPCITAGIAACFGQHIAPCGQCSACRNGALRPRVLPMPHMRPWETCAWLMRWQRDAIAEQSGMSPRAVLSNHAIDQVAQTLELPANCSPAAKKMQPLLDRIRRFESHDTAAKDSCFDSLPTGSAEEKIQK